MLHNPTHGMTTDPAAADQAIAIVGMAGRFPGADDIEAFWKLLREGGSTLRTLDRDTLKENGRSDEEIEGPGFVPVGGHMDDVSRFDAAFFGFTPREASFMDPQLRAMLETAWHVFEDAGKDPFRNGTNTGVFASMKISSYLLRNLVHELERGGTNIETLCVTMNGQDYVATWIAYKLGLTGPAMNVQTACSSGLSSVAIACQHLLDYGCDTALAIAGAITVPQNRGYIAETDSILANGGACRPFDASADGTIFADGVAGLLLRRLDDAVADGDRIVAVIRGFAMNNDGNRKVSYSAPSADGQAEVIASALAMSGLHPADIDYIEAHGTGTHLGDPIEFTALDRIYGGIEREDPCTIGAVKGNVGHTAEAAGAVGLIKAALAVERGFIPANANFDRLNPHIRLEGRGFRIADQAIEWQRAGSKRRAAVSSLGFGGTNCHIVLEEAPATAPIAARAQGPQTLVLSARSRDALDRLRTRYVGKLNGLHQDQLASVCHTALAGRAHLPWRLAASGSDAVSLRRALASQLLPSAKITDAPRLAFIFGGHGIESFGNLSSLAAHVPAFSDTLNEGLALLGERGEPVRRTLFDQAILVGAEAAVLQTAIVLHGIAIARGWQSLGVQADIVVGHSLGEIAAAHIAGVFDLSSALDLAWARGSAMQTYAESGAMLAVTTDEEKARALADQHRLDGVLVVSVINGDSQCVISGDLASVNRLAAACKDGGIKAKRLPVAYAYHSPFMRRAADAMSSAVARIPFRAPTLPIISGMKATHEDGSEMATAAYWCDQIVQPVRFRDAILALASQGITTFLELSAEPLYAAAARATLTAKSVDAAVILTADGETNPALAFESARGRLFVAGHAAQSSSAGGWADLPKYPFAETRFWIDPVKREPASTPFPAVQSLADLASSRQDGEPPEEDALLRELRAIWSERIGTSVAADSDFFALGGSSIVALSILADIEMALGIRPPLTSFLEARTVRGLADVIEQMLNAELLLETA
ncbi:type I polyketide synthase [Ensifer sp. YR511]|uniref:type I polyketide synthase n=1 Tax=Ensifer sp. YR511 TaxID=1855294 RepID=UPI00088E1C9B|nr:type I polyketide synthase [Ensifer sp. YR511]SDN02761.1 Acyl transferase domain-containing protein [Ensifer sp. YR511]